MKNRSLILALFASSLFCFTSCVKQMDMVPTTSPVTAEKFSEIKAPDNFDWSTTNKVTFNFTGMTGAQYQLVLKVMDADGNVLLQKLQKADENYSAIIELASRFDSVIVVYGSKTESLDCTKGSVTLSVD